MFVARRVDDDEYPPRGREEAIGDVDGDVLLAFGRQSVQQQRKVELLALGAEFARIGDQRVELIVEELLRFV